MKYRILYFAIFAFLFAFSCKNNDTEREAKENEELGKHLSTSLVDNPRTLEKGDTVVVSELGKLAFTDTLHDFGRIKEGEIVTFDFEFSNAGKRDIIINEAKASCGCTVPEYPEHPIKSGEKEKIKVTFNSHGKEGYNEKGITITTNGNPAVYYLHILAEVVKE